MTQNNKLFYVILVVVALAIIGIIFFVSSKLPTSPKLQTNTTNTTNTSQTTNAANISQTNTSSSYEIKLKSRTFTPAEDIEQFFTDIKAKNIKPEDLLSGKYHGVVQFYQVPTNEKKSILEKTGIILHDYLPNNAYTASIDPTLTTQQISTLGLVRSLFTLERNDKLSPDIVSGQIGNWARQESGKVDVIVKYYPDVPNDKAQSALQTFGGQIILSSDSFQRITIRIDENKINSLADFEWVSWIEPIAPPPTTY